MIQNSINNQRIQIWCPKWIIINGDVQKKDWAIVLYNKRIIDILFVRDAISKYSEADILDLRDYVICPAFIDCHTHLELFELYNHIGSDIDLYDTMLASGEYHKTATLSEVQIAREKGESYMLSLGTSYCADWVNMYSLAKLGYDDERVVPYLEIINTDEKLSLKNEEKINAFLKKKNSGMAPHSSYMVSPSAIIDIAKLKRPIAIHLAETNDEMEWLYGKKGKLYEHCVKNSKKSLEPLNFYNYKDYLKKVFYRESKVMIVHGAYLKEDDLQFVKKNKWIICVCPLSNYKLGGKILDLPYLYENKINIVLGTDCYQNNLSIFQNAKFYLTSLELNYEKNEIARYLFKAMTEEGAKALNIKAYFSSFEKGNRVDFNLIKLKSETVCESLFYNLITEGEFFCHIY